MKDYRQIGKLHEELQKAEVNLTTVTTRYIQEQDALREYLAKPNPDYEVVGRLVETVEFARKQREEVSSIVANISIKIQNLLNN